MPSERNVAPSASRNAQSAGSTPHGGWALLVVILALLIGLVCSIYGFGLSAPFIFDDHTAIVENPSITTLWPLWGPLDTVSMLRPPRDIGTSGRPLVNLSLALNYWAGGLSPRGYHCGNMVLHVLSALMLFALVRRTLQLAYFGGRFDSVAGVLALAVALVWAAHPLQVDAVQYVTQRTELMVSLCYLSTLYAALRYFTATSGAGRAAWLIAAAAACLAGMASKEVMVTAPVVVLLFERTFIAGSFRQALARSWALYLALALSWLLLLALNIGGPRSESAGFHLEVPAYVWWATQAKVLLMYLKLAVWPHPLVIHYEVPYLDTLSAAGLPVAAVALLCLATIVLLWRRAAVGFLAACMLLILSPTLVVPIISEPAAERRMYLPLAALVALLIVGGYTVAERVAAARRAVGPNRRFANYPTRAAIAGVAFLLVMAFGTLAILRVRVFNDPVALWGEAAIHQPRDYRAQNNWGVALLDAGRPQEAIEKFEQALRLKPDYADAHFNLGTELALTGRPAEAIPHYEEALRLQPDYTDVQSNWGVALLNLNRPEEAITHFEAFVRRKPTPFGYANLAMAYGQAGRRSEALNTGQRALEMARATGQTDLAAQIAAWLTEYSNQ